MADDFTLVAVGDSVVWGQGLAHDRKFVSQVYRRLTGERLPERNVKARSGAQIGWKYEAGDPEDRPEALAETIGPVGTRTGRHECPTAGHTIPEQVERLPYDFGTEETWEGESLRRPSSRAYEDETDVDMVILDGGLNDFGADSVANPFADQESIHENVENYCYRDLRHLLERTRRKFPNAVVVVTGYFPIVSFASDLKQDEILAALSIVPFVPNLVDWGRRHLIRNFLFLNRWALFYKRKAVAEADREFGGPGILFATPGFDADNAMNAPDARLWPALSEGDERVADQRKAVCDAREQAAPDAGSKSKCNVAATGHPNRDGADDYADAIVERYERHVRVPVCEPATKLAGERDGPVSVREAFERYSLDPGDGFRTCLAHTVVDSIAITVETGDNGTNSDVFLEFAGESWELDTKLTDDVAEHNDFEQGSDDQFAIDPLFSTDRTVADPLYLWEIDGVALHKEDFGLADWEVDAVTLWLNGVEVLRSDDERLVEGRDTLEYEYPAGGA